MTERTPGKVGAFDATSLVRPTAYDPDMKRPTATVAGAALVLLRSLAGVLSLVLLWLQFDQVSDKIAQDVDGLSSDAVHGGLVVVVVVTAVVALVDAVFAVLIYRGGNMPRVVVMSIAVVSISSSFIAWWWQGQEINLKNNTLLSLGLDILVLLALSSRSAAAYARRNQRRA
jgi:hypothetical protein